MMTTVFHRVGAYEILHQIGSGGMAVVFLATDTRNSRQVALKLVSMEDGRDGREILEAEHLGARLQEAFCRVSRYVPTVYEYGTQDKYFFIAMEYLEGQNLSDVIGRGALSPESAARIAIQLCEFLEAAVGFKMTLDGKERSSLLHGDLKPRNIRVLGGDEIKVFDFGIAKALSLSRKVTRNDFGSTAYLSPERIESGGDVDAQAEFWAVGVLLYEMVGGIHPFQAPDTRRLEQRIRSRRPPAPFDGRCPLPLEAIIGKLLAGDVAERYGTACDIRDDLQRFTSGQPTRAELGGWPARGNDEAATRRTLRATTADQEPTRRTVRDTGDSQTAMPGGTAGVASAGVAKPGTGRARVRRFVRQALLLMALVIVAHEISVYSIADRLAERVPQDLDGLVGVWSQYDALSGRSLRLGVLPLEHALIPQTVMVTDRSFARYRAGNSVVREGQWRLAQNVLASALRANPSDRNVRGGLRYCEGHLRRIDGEARGREKQADAAKVQLTAAVTAFREAAELRQNWPDPFLGLMRTFIALEDMERGADALAQAQRYGYTAGNRDWAQIADGYSVRGEKLSGREDLESLTRAAEAYSQAIDNYSKVVGFGKAAQNLREAQHRLHQIQDRIEALSAPVGGALDTTASNVPARGGRAIDRSRAVA
jgi:predicted Ser/Thr protein kinase/tetratricopeptide (TPR) repeat protein